MRTLTKKEQNSINGGVGTPPGSIAFAGVVIVLGIMPLLTGSNVSNVSIYVNRFFYNLTNSTA